MGSKICFVSPYAELTTLLEETLSRLPDPPSIVEGATDAAEAVITRAQPAGSEVFVTTEKNARHLQNRFNLPFVVIPFTVFDIAYALHQAKVRYGFPIALFEFRSPSPSVGALQEVIDCEIREFIINDQRDAVAKLRKAKREGCKVVVAGGLTAATARRIGCPCVPLCPNPDAILQAYHQARQVVDTRRKEHREAVKFRYITQYSHAGIIMVDPDHRVTVFNSAAERILGLSAGRALGQLLQDLVPSGPLARPTDRNRGQVEELQVIGQSEVLVSRIPIVDQEEWVGTIFTLRGMEKDGLHGRRPGQMRASGLTAKMRLSDIVTRNLLIGQLIERARCFAATDETVLITGETGTGKEIFAQSIHNASRRKDNAFVAINCAAIPSTLIESESSATRKGLLPAPCAGDGRASSNSPTRGPSSSTRSASCPRRPRPACSGCCQEKEVMRVGDNKVIKIDVRVIGATNQSLEEAMEQGRFRRDLYYRLDILQLKLPPLREHAEDIPALMRTFLHRSCSDRILTARIEEALQKHREALLCHPWRGNIRELQNLVKRVIAIVEMIPAGSLDKEVSNVIREALEQTAPSGLEPVLPQEINFKNLLSRVERYVIEKQSQAVSGNKAMLARKLGIGRTTLWRKLNGRR